MGGVVVASIGYRSEVIDGLSFDWARGTVANDDGRVADGLYAVGWVKRGPSGVIGSNKPDGDLLARQIAADFAEGRKPNFHKR